MYFNAGNGIKSKIAILGILVILVLASGLWLFLFKPMSNSTGVNLFLKEVNARPSRQVDVLKDFPLYIPMDYTGENHRNPFQPSIQKQFAASDGNGPDLKRVRGPLEEFPLDALRMVGVISQNNQLWAIIQAPDNRVYRVSVGDFIGKNYGEIIEITSSELKMTESISDNYGHWAKRSAGLKLSEK